MIGHTKEPWKYRKLGISNYDIVHDHGSDQIECVGGTITEDNAKRIVDCVNALDGLSNDALAGGWNYKDINAYAVRLEEQRRKLLAAIKNVVDAWSSQFERNGHLAPPWAIRARSVIAEIEATK